MRKITDLERLLIEGVASRLPPLEASELATDLEHAVVADDAVPGARVVFAIAGYERRSYKGQHSYPVEIRLSDADGAELTAVLYGDKTIDFTRLRSSVGERARRLLLMPAQSGSTNWPSDENSWPANASCACVPTERMTWTRWG